MLSMFWKHFIYIHLISQNIASVSFVKIKTFLPISKFHALEMDFISNVYIFIKENPQNTPKWYNFINVDVSK